MARDRILSLKVLQWKEGWKNKEIKKILYWTVILLRQLALNKFESKLENSFYNVANLLIKLGLLAGNDNI